MWGDSALQQASQYLGQNLTSDQQERATGGEKTTYTYNEIFTDGIVLANQANAYKLVYKISQRVLLLNFDFRMCFLVHDDASLFGGYGD